MSKLFKSANTTYGDTGDGFAGIPTAEDYELIKTFMPSEIAQEDLFVYKVKLCDNLVDRSYERFTHEALEQVTSRFNGLVGIEDHKHKSNNVHSRLYKTELCVDDKEVNDLGEQYEYVVGYAYTIKNEKNESLIDEIRGGIKKEVSVGLSCKSTKCSICGRDIDNKECTHSKGKAYTVDGVDKVCVGLLDDVNDAYEWSFVAVPCQREAGVTKQLKFTEGAFGMTLKEKVLKLASVPGISSDQISDLIKSVDESSVPESDVVKTLKIENDELKKTLKQKEEVIEQMTWEKRESLINAAIETIMEELKPVNDTMKNIAVGLIRYLLDVNESDGTVVGIEASKAFLMSEDYKPLFSGETKVEPTEPVKTEDTAGEENKEGAESYVEEKEDETVTEKVFTVSKSKKLDFTHVKPDETTGVRQVKKGIRYEEVK